MTGGDASAPSAKLLVDASTQTPESRVSLISATTGNRQASEISDEDKKPSAAAPKIHKLRLLQNNFGFSAFIFGRPIWSFAPLFPAFFALVRGVSPLIIVYFLTFMTPWT